MARRLFYPPIFSKELLMKKNAQVFFIVAIALMLSACEQSLSTKKIVLCDRMKTETNWTEAQCYDHLDAYDACASEFIDVFTCVLNTYDFEWSDVIEMHETLNGKCSSEYSSLRKCTERNGGVMLVEDFCAANGQACGYGEERLDECVDDYGNIFCPEHHAAVYQCVMEHSEGICSGTELSDNIDWNGEDVFFNCSIHIFSYMSCIMGFY